MTRLTLRIFGMDCGACVPQLRKVLLRQRGVQAAQVQYAGGRAVLDVDPDALQLPALEAAITRAGFALPIEQVRLGFPEEADAGAALGKLSALPGVKSAFREGKVLLLALYPTGITAQELQQAVPETSFDVLQWDSGEELLEQQDQLSMLRRLLISIALTTPIFWSPAPLVQLGLATLLQFVPGRYFYRGALRAMGSRQLNMDFLIALSTTVIYLYSTYLTFTVHEDIKLYFLCQGVLLSLLFFGKYLEIVARGETMSSIRALVHLIPQKATILRDGKPMLISADALRPGDVVQLSPGERVPADGMVLTGTCFADESMLTGESEPIPRQPGDRLTGGALNRRGSVTMQVTRVGRDTTLQRMIAMVQEAQSSRAPVQNLVDRIAGVFIPSVLAIAVLVFAIWYVLVSPGEMETALLTMCGVLVVACPCALGLATPTSIMVGTGRGAEMGILFRNAQQMEAAARAQVVVFDKTGTLTLGTARREGMPDELRPDAAEAIRRLKAQGITLIMLSGDKPEIAQAFARQAGIDTVIASAAPEEKANYIRKLKEQGKVVVMVGDGVNDAPALACADVSVTLPSATDAARESAGIVLTGDHLTAVPLALHLARDVMGNIRGNLLWALCYNLVCIPLAACGMMNPSLASAAMSFSSIAVLLHALRLKKAPSGHWGRSVKRGGN